MNKNALNKQYVLGMFPYPSGDGLHVGHVRIYTAVDVMSRYFRMKSFGSAQDRVKVLSPMGWDAFGLPAENAAIKNKVNPQDIVPKNYNNFRKQMQNLNFDFDWEHEFATTDPTYYGLTQWIFLELYKKGLVYREQVPINWCPKCKTGLANEEVLPDGTHERCGTPTTKKNLPQWVMKITAYAERLLSDLGDKAKPESELDWPRGILEMQRNWIGKKEGARVTFKIADENKTFEVFTTRIDTINGVTFVVICPELAKTWIDQGLVKKSECLGYVEAALGKSEQTRLEGEKNKTGVETGLMAINPWNNEQVPIYVADYVLSNVGTGAVMGVPQYDERDKEFAVKYNLQIKDLALDDYKEVLGKLNKQGVATKETTYHLRDWVFSRQRYWGEPIPLVYCDKCGDENGVVPLSEKDLPLTLPYLESYEPTDTGESPLARVTEWVTTTCPKCGGAAKRETDTMPNWAGSCWYHLAFAFWKNESVAADSNPTKQVLDEYRNGKSSTPYSDFWKEYARPAIDKYLPVDWYLGGAEHAVLHLLYARFWMKVLYDLGHLGFVEPYTRLRSVGIVLAEDGRKMSKSWGNVINPDDVVKEYGSDAVRLYEMFMGPWDQAIAWDPRSLVGLKRFIEKLESVFADKSKIGDVSSPILAVKLSELARKVETDIIEQKFNTAIAGCMEFVNAWRSANLVISQKHAQDFAHILSPFAPQTAQKVFEMARGEGKVAAQIWPEVKSEKLEIPLTVAIQINGKLRGTASLSSTDAMSESNVMDRVLNDEKIAKWLPSDEGWKPKKVIFVPGKLINVVI